MKVYRIEIEVLEAEDAKAPRYEGVKNDARDYVRAQIPKQLWPQVTVTECDVQSDKAGIIAALNGSPIIKCDNAQWGISNRGALKEEALGS